MARPIERCIGEVRSAGGGRQLGDRCRNRGYALQHHLCHLHQGQHNNPNYPTSESCRLRANGRPDHTPRTEVQPNTSQAGPSNRETPVDNPSTATANAESSQQNYPQRQPASLSRSDERSGRTHQTEVQQNASQAGPSTRQRPVDNPSRTTAYDEPWQPNFPQRRPASSRSQLPTISESSQLNSPQREPASSRSQLPTPPEQSNRRRHATPEPMSLHDRTPTQASNTVIKPIRKLMSQHTPTRQSRESNEIRFPRVQNLPPTPASSAVNDVLSQSRREQSSIPQPSPSTADKSLPTQNTPTPQFIRRESSEIRYPRLQNLPFTPASPTVPPRPRPEQSRIPQPSPSTADRSLPTQDTLPPPVIRRESSEAQHSGLYILPPAPASPDLNDILSRFEPEQRGVSEPSPSSADSNNEQNETESQPQRTHRHNSSNTSEQSSIAGSSSTNSIPRSSPPPLIPQARSILRQRSRLVRNLSYALVDAGQITSNDRLRAVFTEPTSVPGDSSILDIIVDMLQGYMGLRYMNEMPKGLAAKLLRAACDQGEEGERFAEQLRQWVRRGGTVDDDVVEAFGLDDFEEWMRVGEGWMTRTWGFLSSMMDLRKEKRD